MIGAHNPKLFDSELTVNSEVYCHRPPLLVVCVFLVGDGVCVWGRIIIYMS